MPESPRHLLIRCRDRDSARRALLWLRGGNELEASIQLKSLEEEVQDMDKNPEEKMTALRLISNRRYSRPLLVSLLLMLLNQSSGINVIVFYAQTIFKHAGSHMDPGKLEVKVLDSFLYQIISQV